MTRLHGGVEVLCLHEGEHADPVLHAGGRHAVAGEALRARREQQHLAVRGQRGSHPVAAPQRLLQRATLQRN